MRPTLRRKLVQYGSLALALAVGLVAGKLAVRLLLVVGVMGLLVYWLWPKNSNDRR